MLFTIANTAIEITHTSIHSNGSEVSIAGIDSCSDPGIQYAVLVGKILELTQSDILIKKELCNEQYTLNILEKAYKHKLTVPQLTRLGWYGYEAQIVGIQHGELCKFGTTLINTNAVGLVVNSGPKRVIEVSGELTSDLHLSLFRYLTLRTNLRLGAKYFELDEPAMSDASLCNGSRCVTDVMSLRALYG